MGGSECFALDWKTSMHKRPRCKSRRRHCHKKKKETKGERRLSTAFVVLAAFAALLLLVFLLVLVNWYVHWEGRRNHDTSHHDGEHGPSSSTANPSSSM